MPCPSRIAPPVILLLAACAALTTAEPAATSSDTAAATDAGDPPPPSWRFESAVAAIEARNADAPRGAVVFVGSSSVTGWWHLTRCFPGHSVLKRGFGGSSTPDQLKALPRIVLPIEPSVVAYYCGDNDLSRPERDPQRAVDGFVAWLDALHAALPATQVLYLAIKPSPARAAAWPTVQLANQRIAALCAERDGVTFVDVATPLLTAEGEMRPELYRDDRLHLNRAGYDQWIPVITAALDAVTTPDRRP